MLRFLLSLYEWAYIHNDIVFTIIFHVIFSPFSRGLVSILKIAYPNINTEVNFISVRFVYETLSDWIFRIKYASNLPLANRLEHWINTNLTPGEMVEW